MIFGSDNLSGASEQVLRAVAQAFTRTSDVAYGDDRFCADAASAFSELFECDVTVFFTMSGTAANTLALSTLVKPWEGVICHHQAHILLDESSGPALMSGGAALLPVPSRELKLTTAALNQMLERLPNEPPHNIRARALSLSQASECGQIYSVAEVSDLCQVAKDAGLSVHMDGARFANAVASLGCTPADITWKAGVDVLCLGATKNGAMAAEAVLFFKPHLAEDFDYRLKRSGHLVSKGRLFGAQFLAWLQDAHWLELARHANDKADELRDKLASAPGIRLAFDCQSNETFVILDKSLHQSLLDAGATLYDWYPDALPPSIDMGDNELLARMVTSFESTSEHIDLFIQHCESHAAMDQCSEKG